MRRIKTLTALAGLFPALLVWLTICCPLTHAAKDAKEGKPLPEMNETFGNSQSPIYITADRMEANQDQKTIIFESHVVVKQDDVTITSNRLRVTLLQGENQPAQPAKPAKPAQSAKPGLGDSSATDKIDYIEFEGDVKVTQQDRLATAHKAIFYQKEQKILLTGHPVVTKGQDRVEGNLITIYLKEGRSIVEGGSGGQVQAVLFPGKKE